MSAAQVILNSLNGLFDFTEMATKDMMDIVDRIDIPELWESVDLIKQTGSLMCTTAGLSLTDELLYVRKAQAIVDFCVECKNLLNCLELDISSEGNLIFDSIRILSSKLLALALSLPLCGKEKCKVDSEERGLPHTLIDGEFPTECSCFIEQI